MSFYKKNLSSPHFEHIFEKKKTVEGRLNKGDFAKMKIDDIIEFTNNEFGYERKFEIKIKKINYYNNFTTYLENEGLERCLPGVNTLEEGLKIYYKYYTKNEEIEYKIKAFIFE